ncbi:MAG: response regulator transcription factor [Verrucomicrobia bacterium]|jgi:DNA-binding NarL/FixJ family response regulator|nr:response regulator transcription factor [Verrucomicrobiota bacterium]
MRTPANTSAAPRPDAATIRVSIVEDDDWIRDNLAAGLDDTPGLRCLSRFRSAEEALAALPAAPPEVVLMDIGLPKMTGIECVRQLKAVAPSIQVLMLTVYGDSERVFSALLAGADGYLLKRASREELLDAIRQVHRGESPMDGHIARQVVQFFNRRGAAPAEVDQLSRREREVLEQLARGAAYKQIADTLGISIETLRGYIKVVYRKLHVHSRGEAVAKYGPR